MKNQLATAQKNFLGCTTSVIFSIHHPISHHIQAHHHC